jgi:hypothetical protein
MLTCMCLFFLSDRMAYHESVQLGHELTKKIDRIGNEGDSDGGAPAGYHSDDDAAASDDNSQEPVSRRVAVQLGGAVGRGSEADAPEATGKFKKLFEMSFMKNAKERQQERAREDAIALLKEIRETEREAGSDEESVGLTAAADKRRPSKGAEGTGNSLKDLEKQRAARQKMESLFGGKKPTESAAAATVSAAGVKESGESAREKADESNPWLSSLSSIGRRVEDDLKRSDAAKKRKGASGAAIVVSVPLATAEEAAVDRPAQRNSKPPQGPSAAPPVLAQGGDGAKKRKAPDSSAPSGVVSSAGSVWPVKADSSAAAAAAGGAGAAAPVAVASKETTGAAAAAAAATDANSKKKQGGDRKPLLMQRSQVMLDE